MQQPLEAQSTRRSFLSTIATSSAAIAAAGVGMQLTASDASASEVASDFSDAWLGKLTGKHKQFFDATSANQFALVFAMNFLNSNNDPYKIPDSQLSAVVGLRHFAMPMALKDNMWAKYKVAEFTQTMDAETK